MSFRLVSSVIDQCIGDIKTGTRPVLWPMADGGQMSQIEIGPGRVLLLGGMPGAGKTALLSQWVFEACRLNPDLRVFVSNVEMSEESLMERQLARLSGVNLSAIRKRALTDAEQVRVLGAAEECKRVLGERIAFSAAPFTMVNVLTDAVKFGPDVIVLDYLQRFTPLETDLKDKRAAVDSIMSTARRAAGTGGAVIAVAAVSRQRSADGGTGYKNLDLSSFRESSELEYGADDAFILVRDSDDDLTRVTLRHLKCRNGDMVDVPLTFERPIQRFTERDAEDVPPPPVTRGRGRKSRVTQAEPVEDTRDEDAKLWAEIEKFRRAERVAETQ